MEWSDFIEKEQKDDNANSYFIQTDIRCPECGKFVYLNNSVVCLSSPPKSEYLCVCGWVERSFIRWIGSEDSKRPYCKEE